MAENWAADVKKYVSDADDTVIAGIVKYCGIALRKRDSSLVAFSDPDELARVRNNFLKKKLGLPHANDVLDEAIAKVGQVMKADKTKNRVTVYYLLAQGFDKLGVFASKAKAPAKAPAAKATKAAKAPAAKASATKAAPAKAAPAKAAPAKAVAKPAKAEKPPAAKAVPAKSDAKAAPKASAAAKPAAKSKAAAEKAPAKAAEKKAPAKKATATKAAAAAAGVASLAAIGTKGAKAAKSTASAAKGAAKSATKAATGAAAAAGAVAGAAAASASDAAAKTVAVAGDALSGAADAVGDVAGKAGAVVAEAAGAAAAGAASLASGAGDAVQSLVRDEGDGEGGSMRWLWLLLLMLALLALLWWLFFRTPADSNSAAGSQASVEASAAPVTMPSEFAAAPAEGQAAIPSGEGVTVETRDGKPVVKVYFTTGKTAVPAALESTAAGLKAYLDANPGSALAVSGYNDASGNAAANAEVSKSRAQAVKAALVKAGAGETAVELVKPANTTDANVPAAAARRVEISVK